MTSSRSRTNRVATSPAVFGYSPYPKPDATRPQILSCVFIERKWFKREICSFGGFGGLERHISPWRLSSKLDERNLERTDKWTMRETNPPGMSRKKGEKELKRVASSFTFTPSLFKSRATRLYPTMSVRSCVCWYVCNIAPTQIFVKTTLILPLPIRTRLGWPRIQPCFFAHQHKQIRQQLQYRIVCWTASRFFFSPSLVIVSLGDVWKTRLPQARAGGQGQCLSYWSIWAGAVRPKTAKT